MKLPSSRHNKSRSNALNFTDCVDKADKWREDKMFSYIPILQVGNGGGEQFKSDSLKSTRGIPDKATDHKPQEFQAFSSIITKSSFVPKLFSF